MRDSVLHNYAFNLSYLKMLVDDIPQDQMADQPAGMVNHPAWTLAHLVTGSEFAASLLGLEPSISEDWRERFGRGSTPVADLAVHPPKDEALAELQRQHNRVAEALRAADGEFLARQTPDEEFRQVMPTLGDALAYILVAHEATHLGQIIAWRRLKSLPPVLG